MGAGGVTKHVCLFIQQTRISAYFMLCLVLSAGETEMIDPGHTQLALGTQVLGLTLTSNQIHFA